ncbi:MAG: amino acid-binding protein, partial [Planctomycetota bacterium]|nr:amino acid-binding protein [Planctomycetota bacterium]
ANDWEKARDALIQAGFVVNVTEVLAVEVDDKPGGLLALLDIVGELEVNIEYMYAFTRRRGENAVMVFRFDDPDRAITALRSKNVRILSSSEVLG